ncbi:MAG: hypothetical protein ABI718_11545 [Acidobacteriota bacterium]
MARGWESKSVESQIEDRRNELDDARGRLPQDELERATKRQSLEMSRRRVATDLETSSTPVHRAALENALKFLDGELHKLE